MANDEHLAILKQGVEAWNKWRGEHPDISPDLRGANFKNADLFRANLSETDLYQVNLRRANLSYADLSGANLGGADLGLADLSYADLSGVFLNGANLRGANLREANLNRAFLLGADLGGANLGEANLTEAFLVQAMLVKTDLKQADISGCHVYGISAWGVNLEGTTQSNLVITDGGEPVVTVDNLEVAQFVYLLLHNAKIRDVIDTITTKAVLILGRFTDERKAVLDAIRENLRQRGYVPILFDFEKSQERDFTETIKVLAGMSLFVIADITNPKSSPLELQATVPDYMIPFAPIIQSGESPFSMFVNLQKKYGWVLDVREYNDKEHLLTNFENGIIKPALAKHNELLVLKNEALKIRPIDEN